MFVTGVWLGVAIMTYHDFADGRSARHRGNTSDAPCRFCASCVDCLAHALVECPAHHQARSRWRLQISGRRVLSLHTLFSTDPAVNTARNIECNIAFVGRVCHAAARVRCDLSCRNQTIFPNFVIRFWHVGVILASYFVVAAYGDPVTSCIMFHFLTITHGRSKTSLFSAPPICKHNARMMGSKAEGLGGAQPPHCKHNARLMGLNKMPETSLRSLTSGGGWAALLPFAKTTLKNTTAA